MKTLLSLLVVSTLIGCSWAVGQARHTDVARWLNPNQSSVEYTVVKQDGDVAADPFRVFADAMGGDRFGSYSSSVTSANGVTTTKVTADGQNFTIVESAQQVEVTYTKTYGPDDLEALQQDHPDLHMHVTGFPETSQGATVNLTVGIETTATAVDAETLKEEHPEAFAIYEKFTQQGAMPGGLRRAIEIRGVPMEGFAIPRIEGMRIPRIEFAPMFRAFPPAGVDRDRESGDGNSDDGDSDDKIDPMANGGRTLIRT